MGTVLEVINAAKPSVADVLVSILADAGISPESCEFTGKSMADETHEVVGNSVVHYFATGGLGIDSEVLLMSGADESYIEHARSVIYNHDYKGLQVGKCMWFKRDEIGYKARTVFATHKLGESLKHLYCDDVEGTGPIANCWSVDYIPMKVEKPGTRGWREALSTALAERPDLAEVKDKIKSIVTKWLILGYSATPMGINPEAVSVKAGKAIDGDLAEAYRYISDESQGEPADTSADETPVPDEKPVVDTETAKTDQNEEATDAPQPDTDGTENGLGDPGEGAALGGEGEGEAGESVPANEEAADESEENTATGEVVVDDNLPQPVTTDTNIEIEGLDDTADKPAAESTEIVIDGITDGTADGTPEAKSFDPETRLQELTDMHQSGAMGKGIGELMTWYALSIPVFGVIETTMATMVCDWLLASSIYDPDTELTLVINSQGGEVDAGFAIIDTMNFIPNPVRTIAIGEVCSMGLLISMAGDTRIVSENASILSHRFWGGAVGSQAELEAVQKQWAIVHKRIVNHYIAHSKYNTADDVEAKLLQTVDVWLLPKEAIKHGLFDRVLDDKTELVSPQSIPEDMGTDGKAIRSVAEVKVDLEPVAAEVRKLRDEVAAEFNSKREAYLLTAEGRKKLYEAIEIVGTCLNYLEDLSDYSIPAEVPEPKLFEEPKPAEPDQSAITNAVREGIIGGFSPLSDRIAGLQKAINRATGRVE